METLNLRMHKFGENAALVAIFWRGAIRKIASVNYLGFFGGGRPRYRFFRRHVRARALLRICGQGRPRPRHFACLAR